MEVTLEQAISAFERNFDWFGWQYQKGAQGQCSDASNAFAQFLLAAGIDANVRPLIGLPAYVRDTRPADDTPDELHIVVEIGKALDDSAIYIDWTRRQYQPNAPWPTISTKQELEADGWRVVTVQEGYDWCARVKRMAKEKRATKKIARDRAARGEA